jgi:hypothetical protein
LNSIPLIRAAPIGSEYGIGGINAVPQPMDVATGNHLLNEAIYDEAIPVTEKSVFVAKIEVGKELPYLTFVRNMVF